MAGVMPTRRESAAAMSHSQSPNTCVKLGFPGSFFCNPVFGSNGVGP